MATYDPVLERKMFKAKEKPSKGKGIADLGEEDSVDTADMSDYEARRQMAMQMLDAAREKHDPSNFKTLAENERPMVFRPTAVNLPQPQQPVPAAQQMARMQAAGIRPVGMAHGGAVRYGYAGVNGSFVTPNGPAGLESLPEASTLSPTQKAPYNIESNPNVKYNDPDDPTTWSPDFKEAMVDKVYRDRIAERNTIDPNFRSYVKEPKKDDIALELDLKAADLRRGRGDSPARSEAAARERAMPDKRDYGQEREAAASGIRAAEDQSHREQAMPDKRDYGQEREGLASINRGIEDAAARERAAPDKRDYGQEREANKGIAALGNEVRTGNAPGAAAEAARPATIPGAAAAIGGGAPAPATGGNTGAGGPATGEGAAKSNEPAKYAPSTSLESIKADRAKERDDNINLALINAGLAMMGGKSSNALVNIGEGGMQGIRQFTEAQRETNRGYREDVRGMREDERAKRALEENSRQFGITSGLEGQRVGLEGRRLTEAERAATANEAIAAELGRGRLEVERQNANRLDKALNEDIKTTAAKLGISTQELGVQRDKLKQEADQFSQTLSLKKDEYKTNIEVATAKRDESMLSDLHKNITTDLGSIENNKTRLQGNMYAGMMNPEDFKDSMRKLNEQEAGLRGQLTALRANMSDRLKLSLPTPNLSQSDPFGIRSTQ